MRDKPLSEILALMDERAVLSVAKEISSYLGHKAWEKEEASKEA